MRDRPLFPKFSSNSNGPLRLPPQNTDSQKDSPQADRSQASSARQLSGQQSSSLSQPSAAKGRITRKQQADGPQPHQDVAQKALSDSAFSEFCENVLLTVDCGAAIPLIIRQIKHWTSGQPFLTRIICEQVLKVGDKVTQDNASTLIDQIVHQDILKDWHKGLAADHMRAIAAQLRSVQNKDLLLLLYLRILQQGSAESVDSDERNVLLRSGLVVERGKRLEIANLIYAKVFGMAWIEKALPGITRPVNIVRSPAPQLPSSRSAQRSSKPPAQRLSKALSKQPSNSSSKPPTAAPPVASSGQSFKYSSEPSSELSSESSSEQLSKRPVNEQTVDKQPVDEQPANKQLAKSSSESSSEQGSSSLLEQSEQPTERPSEVSGLYSKVAVFICCLAVLTAAISAYRSGSRETVLTPSAEVSGSEQLQQEQATVSSSVSSSNGESEAFEAENRRLFDRGITHATNGRWLPMVRDFCQISANSAYFTPAQKQVQQWVNLYREDVEIAQATFLAEDIRGESGGCSLISDVL